MIRVNFCCKKIHILRPHDDMRQRRDVVGLRRVCGNTNHMRAARQPLILPALIAHRRELGQHRATRAGLVRRLQVLFVRDIGVQLHDHVLQRLLSVPAQPEVLRLPGVDLQEDLTLRAALDQVQGQGAAVRGGAAAALAG